MSNIANQENLLKLIFLARESKDFELSRNRFGSFSCLTPERNNILVIPKGIDAFSLRPKDIIILDRKGEIIENENNNRLPDDMNLHLVCYDEREGSVDVVMHINPKNATMRADEGNRIIFLSDCIDPDDSETGDISTLIKIPIAHRDYMLIKNNGIIVVGEGIFETLEKAKYIEEIAKIKVPKEEPVKVQITDEGIVTKTQSEPVGSINKKTFKSKL